MKNNVVKSFIRKVLTVSHRDFHLANKQRIIDILQRNNFPMKLIHKLYGQVVHSYKNNTARSIHVSPEQNNQQTKRKSYPFLPDESKASIGIGTDNVDNKFAAMTYIHSWVNGRAEFTN